jgi:hypothetical protein
VPKVAEMAAPRSGNRAVRIRPNAGIPVYPSGTRPRLRVMGSDNPVGADNQQERLIEQRGWVIGFVDREGCFSTGWCAKLAHDAEAATEPAGGMDR